jgi:tRNA(fMet)-specific endonuclease VapC
MNWLLDTNACIRYLNGRAPNLKSHIDASSPTDLLVCSIVKAELYAGAAKSTNPSQSRAKQDAFLLQFRSLVFDDAAADVYGAIRAELEMKGQPIGPNDLFIAAIALANHVTLVTHNTNEFGRVTGLMIEDWEASP